jgi:hypothetical protein
MHIQHCGIGRIRMLPLCADAADGTLILSGLRNQYQIAPSATGFTITDTVG